MTEYSKNPLEERMIAESLAHSSLVKKQKNLISVPIDYITKETSILFTLLPEWSKHFPPYNIARLIALAKSNGYKASGIDLNIKAYRDYLKNWRHKIDFDPWDPARDWKWRNFYFEDLHPHMQPLLEEYLDNIQTINPTAIGFTLYYCNEPPTQWVVKQIKERYPHIAIIVGGPQCHLSEWKPIPEYDYIVSGEGEISMLKILSELEEKGKASEQIWIKQPDKQRLDLSMLPHPDYESFNFNEYGMPNGVNSELSRGCIAKCVYCLETHYWKYRDRTANSVLGEIIKLNKERGTNHIYFIDSLVNGNLLELRNFAKGIIENNLKLTWVGYARSDKRMDLEYYKDLALSGCLFLNYGFESGSNKVLEDINKKCTREDIEQNLRDSSRVGIKTASNWIVGFPTETYQDFYETLTLIWRTRNCNFDSISINSFGLAADTIAAQNIEKFGISTSWFGDNWIGKDASGSKIHRLIRLKSFNILLHIINKNRFVYNLIGGGRNMTNFYNLSFDIKKQFEVNYETFDFKIIDCDINPFAMSLVNEIWPLLRILWRVLGEYEIEIIFDPEKDFNEFGPWSTGNFTANYKFKIDKNGKWTADFYMNFIHDDSCKWTNGADQGWANSVSASRARILALGGDGSSTWNEEREKHNHEAYLENLKKCYSFETHYKNKGKWT